MAIDFKQIEMYSDKIYDKVLGYREHLHRNPELSYKEYNTSKFVSSVLSEIGIDNFSIGDTGIAALISGDHHSENMTCIALEQILMLCQFRRRMRCLIKVKLMGSCTHVVTMYILLYYLEQRSLFMRIEIN